MEPFVSRVGRSVLRTSTRAARLHTTQPEIEAPAHAQSPLLSPCLLGVLTMSLEVLGFLGAAIAATLGMAAAHSLALESG